MKNYNHRLVLECVTLVAALIRLLNEILVLLNTAINYADESKVVTKISA
jgi:hypothetical protein